MSPEESAIVGAYTGFLCGPFDVMHEYIEKIMGRPVFTHEMGSKEFMEKVSEAAKTDFVTMAESVSKAHDESK